MELISPQPHFDGQAARIGAERQSVEPSPTETLARRALEHQREGAFSDREWQTAKERLLAFTRMVQAWTSTR